MKINEQLIFNAGRRELKCQPPNFERWINNPTQNTSGDEYYWQHQDQLQQSALHFNSLPAAKADAEKSGQHTRTDREEHLVNTEKPIESKVNPSSDGSMPYQSTHAETHLLNSSISRAMEYHKTPEPVPKTETDAPLNIKTPPRAKEKITTNNRPIPLTPSKNHHLFIQEEQVELSINLNEINPAEQKKLIHIMKQTLKQKGLDLNQVLINGVKK